MGQGSNLPPGSVEGGGVDTVMPVFRNWMGLPVTPGVGRGKDNLWNVFWWLFIGSSFNCILVWCFILIHWTWCFPLKITNFLHSDPPWTLHFSQVPWACRQPLLFAHSLIFKKITSWPMILFFYSPLDVLFCSSSDTKQVLQGKPATLTLYPVGK